MTTLPRPSTRDILALYHDGMSVVEITRLTGRSADYIVSRIAQEKQQARARAEKPTPSPLALLNDAVALAQGYGLMIRADADMRAFTAFDQRGCAVVTVRLEAE